MPSLPPAVFPGGLGSASCSSPVSSLRGQDFCGHSSGFPSSSSSTATNAGPDAFFGGTSLTLQPTVSTSTTSIDNDNSSVVHGETMPNPPKRRRTKKDSKRKKSPPFSEQETVVLLDIWSDAEINQLLRKPGMKRPVWEKISKQMSQHGYTRSPDQCIERIRLLEKKYKQIKEQLNHTGEENNADSFQFFDQMDLVLSGNPSVEPHFMVDSHATAADEVSSITNSVSRSESPSSAFGQEPEESSDDEVVVVGTSKYQKTSTKAKEKGQRQQAKQKIGQRQGSHTVAALVSGIEKRMETMEDRFLAVMERQLEREEDLTRERMRNEQENQEKQQKFFLEALKLLKDQ